MNLISRAVRIPIVAYDLLFYTSRILDGRPFAFSRFGDGEWACILKARGANCDGHEYFPELGSELRDAILAQHDGDYYYAMGPRGQRVLGRQIEDWLQVRRLHIPWHACDVFLRASLDGRLFPLVDALCRRRVLYVGPQHLHRLMYDRVGAIGTIEVPLVNCYQEIDGIEDHILMQAEQTQPDVIGFSAGMTANALIERLYPVLGQEVSLIDFGSLWDVYAGVKSRSYMIGERYDWERLAALNFGE